MEKAPSVVTISSLDQLLHETRKERMITFKVGDQLLSMKIRGLTSEELSTANSLTNDVIPPKVMMERTNPITQAIEKTPDYNYEDPDFRIRLAKATKERRAFILEKGLVGIELIGANMVEKAKNLEDNFRDNVLSFLSREIERDSAGELEVLELTNFTTGSASPAALS